MVRSLKQAGLNASIATGSKPATSKPAKVPEKSSPEYRAYADAKYGYLTAGTFPTWVWIGIAVAAVAVGFAIVKTRK